MPKTTFIIIGPFVDETLLYWNVDKWEWVSDYNDASHFPQEILTLPLPRGVSSVMEVLEDGEPVTNYTPHPGGLVKTFDSINKQQIK